MIEKIFKIFFDLLGYFLGWTDVMPSNKAMKAFESMAKRNSENLVPYPSLPDYTGVSSRWNYWRQLYRVKEKTLFLWLLRKWNDEHLEFFELELLDILVKRRAKSEILFAHLERALNSRKSCKTQSLATFVRSIEDQDLALSLYYGFWGTEITVLTIPSNQLRKSFEKQVLRLYDRLFTKELSKHFFSNVRKRRKRGYDDHGSLSQASKADKALLRDIANFYLQKVPSWRSWFQMNPTTPLATFYGQG